MFHQDADRATVGVFLDKVNNAIIQYGGGQVLEGSTNLAYSPLDLITSRPTISYDTITNNANAAISADPDSFSDSLGRLGPDIHNNTVTKNTYNAIFVRIDTQERPTDDDLGCIGAFSYHRPALTSLPRI